MTSAPTTPSTSWPAWMIAGLVIAVAGTSFGVSRGLIASAQEEGRPKVDSLLAVERQAKDAADAKERVNARRDLLTTIEAALVKRPLDSTLVLNAANASYDIGDFERAVTYYRRFITSIDSTNEEVRIDYGYALFASGEQEAGIDVVRRVIARNGRNQIALLNLGVMYANLKRLDEAIPLLERCIAVDPASSVSERAAGILASIRSTT